jgi:hypothetical protein
LVNFSNQDKEATQNDTDEDIYFSINDDKPSSHTAATLYYFPETCVNLDI